MVKASSPEGIRMKVGNPTKSSSQRIVIDALWKSLIAGLVFIWPKLRIYWVESFFSLRVLQEKTKKTTSNHLGLTLRVYRIKK